MPKKTRAYKGSQADFEQKMKRVMQRLGIPESSYVYNWDRFGSDVKFFYKGREYQYEITLENQKDLKHVSDCFARLVLRMQDIARLVEIGMYDFNTGMVGLKALPPGDDNIPEKVFSSLGLPGPPGSMEEIDAAYKKRAKELHPDNGGNSADFAELQELAEQARRYFKEFMR